MAFTGMGDNSIEIQIEGDSSDLQSEVGAAQTTLLEFKKAARVASTALGALSAGGLAAAFLHRLTEKHDVSRIVTKARK